MKGIRTRPLLALALIAGLSACGSDSRDRKSVV